MVPDSAYVSSTWTAEAREANFSCADENEPWLSDALSQAIAEGVPYSHSVQHVWDLEKVIARKANAKCHWISQKRFLAKSEDMPFRQRIDDLWTDIRRRQSEERDPWARA